MHAITVMGVAGCGKTSLGQGLAAALGFTFLEGDSFHDAASVAKMAAGSALTDADPMAGWSTWRCSCRPIPRAWC